MYHVINPSTGNLDAVNSNNFMGVLSSAPASPNNGDTYIDSGDGKFYIYWGTWQVVATLTPPTPPAIATGQPIGLLLCLTYQL